MPSYNFDNNVLNTFVNGQIVSADDAIYGLNPKMVMIADAINDHATSIDTLVGQVGSLGGLVYSVIAYGADPTGVTDSTVAIQNAIGAAISNKGIVVFGNGTYTISDTLNVNASCYITSDGSGTGVTIRQVTSGKGFFSSIPVVPASIRITDLILDIQNTASANGLIYYQKVSGTPSSLTVQRCVFTSTSATKYGFLGVYIQGASSGAVTDCTFTGTASTTSNGVSLYDSANVLIARNSFTYMTNAVTTNSTTPAPSGIVKGLVIENNYIAANKGDGFVIRYITDVLITNNFFEVFTGTSAKFYAISITANDVIIEKNRVDHFSSATIFYHGAVKLSGGFIVKINDNSFLYGGSAIATTASAFILHLLISQNHFYQNNDYAIESGIFAGVSNKYEIVNNIFEDVWSTTNSSCAAVYHAAGAALTLVGNVLVRGSKSATYVLVWGISLTISAGEVLYQSNDFSAATTNPITSPTDLKIYSTDGTGKKSYLSISTSAPTTGTWIKGTKVVVYEPAAGGYTGYVCTVAGTPGTWKGFGLIQV